MSKLIENLDKVGTITPSPMGFGTSRDTKKSPPLMLLGLSQLKSRRVAAKLPLDSLIFTTDVINKSTVQNFLTLSNDVPWGIWINEFEPESLEVLENEAVDYLVFSDITAPATILASDNLGRIIATPPDFPEELAHGLNEIPIDAIILTGIEDTSPISVKDLLRIRSFRDIVDKPILILRSVTLTKQELEILRDIGIQGIIVDCKWMDPQLTITLRDEIDTLLPRKTRNIGSKALLPTLNQEPEQTYNDDDDYDDDGDYDE